MKKFNTTTIMMMVMRMQTCCMCMILAPKYQMCSPSQK